MTTKLQTDFDKIAELDDSLWNNNNYFHPLVMNSIPGKISNTLDIGCGKGTLSQLLAKRASKVTGIDISCKMIKIAKESSLNNDNIDFINADILTYSFPENSFDVIVSIASLHHMNSSEIYPKIVSLLKKNGHMIIVDLHKLTTLKDLIYSVISKPYELILRYTNTGSFFIKKPIKDLWKQHTQTESYLSIKEVRILAQKHFPGAIVKQHLLWRYSLIWTKP